MNSNRYVFSVVKGRLQLWEEGIKRVTGAGDKIVILNCSAQKNAPLGISISVSAVDTDSGKVWHVKDVWHVSLEPS